MFVVLFFLGFLPVLWAEQHTTFPHIAIQLDSVIHCCTNIFFFMKVVVLKITFIFKIILFASPVI